MTQTAHLRENIFKRDKSDLFSMKIQDCYFSLEFSHLYLQNTAGITHTQIKHDVIQTLYHGIVVIIVVVVAILIIITLDIALSSPVELVDNIDIPKPLTCCDHNQVHFNIHIKIYII